MRGAIASAIVVGARWPLQNGNGYVNVFNPTTAKYFIEIKSIFRTTKLAERPHKRHHKPYPSGAAARPVTSPVVSIGWNGVGQSLHKKPNSTAATARQIPRSLNKYPQNNRVRAKTTYNPRQTLPTCSGGDMMSSRRSALLNFSRGCDDCSIRLCCLLLSAALLADQKSKVSHVTTSGLVGTLHST